jgi:hypothetical protein
MKIKYSSPILIGFIATVALLSNCIRKAEFEGYGAPEYWNGGLRTPLIRSSLTLGDAIGTQTAGTGLIEASDKSYYFTYQDSVVSDNAATMMTFNPVNATQKISIPGAPIAAALPADTTITYDYDLQFDNIVLNNDINLLYLLLKEGSIVLNVNSTFNQKTYYTITLNSIVHKDTKQALVISDSLIHPNNTQNSPSKSLNDYMVVMNTGGVPGTSIKAKVAITIKSSGAVMSTTAQDLNFSFSIDNMKMKRLVGQIKNLPFPAKSDTTIINVFNNDIINKIKFADPSIKFSFENSLGVPIKVDLGNIKALSGNKVTSLTSTVSDSLPNFSLGYPDTTKFGQSVKSSVTINKQNTPNLIDFLYSSPDHLIYSIGGVVGTNKNEYHFIEDVSKVKVKYELKVPIYGEIGEMSNTKVIAYEFPDSLHIDSLTFLTDIINNVPLNVKVQVYLTDSDTTKYLDSLFFNPNPLENMNVFDAATGIDVNGKATIPNHKMTYISRGNAWYEKVAKRTRFLIVKGTFYTPKGKMVRFYSNDAVNVNINWAMKGRYHIQVK